MYLSPDYGLMFQVINKEFQTITYLIALALILTAPESDLATVRHRHHLFLSLGLTQRDPGVQCDPLDGPFKIRRGED